MSLSSTSANCGRFRLTSSALKIGGEGDRSLLSIERVLAAESVVHVGGAETGWLPGADVRLARGRGPLPGAALYAPAPAAAALAAQSLAELRCHLGT